MTTPDKTQASAAQDQTEAREPGARGWFQPLSPLPAAEAGGDQNGPVETGEPGPDAGSPGARADGSAEPDDQPPEGSGKQDTADTTHTQVGEPTAEVGDPKETAVFPRLLADEQQAEASEPAAPD